MTAHRTSSPPRPRPAMQRVQWFTGAELTHRDLADAVAHEARMLALHVAALHDTWGVAPGLTLALSSDQRSVLVGPGVAYTSIGDALVLAKPTPAPPFPATALMADLVIAAPNANDAWPCERLHDCGGQVPRERPSLRWETAADASNPAALFSATLAPGIRFGEDVPLGRCTRHPDGTLAGPDLQVRRTARGLVRPHVGFGVLAPGTLAWVGTGAELTASVDTSAAGFTLPPRYVVWLTAGDPWPAGVIGPFVSIQSPDTASFTLGLLCAVRSPATLPAAAVRARAAGASVFWIGVESTSGCSPSLAGPNTLDPGLWAAALAALQGDTP